MLIRPALRLPIATEPMDEYVGDGEQAYFVITVTNDGPAPAVGATAWTSTVGLRPRPTPGGGFRIPQIV